MSASFLVARSCHQAKVPNVISILYKGSYGPVVTLVSVFFAGRVVAEPTYVEDPRGEAFFPEVDLPVIVAISANHNMSYANEP